MVLAGMITPASNNNAPASPSSRPPVVHFGKYAVVSTGGNTTYWPYNFPIECYYSTSNPCPSSNPGSGSGVNITTITDQNPSQDGYSMNAYIPQLEPNAQLSTDLATFFNYEPYQVTQFVQTGNTAQVANGTAASSNTQDGSIGNGAITYANLNAPGPPPYNSFTNQPFNFLNTWANSQVIVTSHTGSGYVLNNVLNCDGSSNWAWTLDVPSNAPVTQQLTPWGMNIQNAGAIYEAPGQYSWTPQNPGTSDELQGAQPNTWCLDKGEGLNGSFTFDYPLPQSSNFNTTYAVAALGTEENINHYEGNNPWVFNGWQGDHDNTSIGSADAGTNLGLEGYSTWMQSAVENAYDTNVSVFANGTYYYTGGGSSTPDSWIGAPAGFGNNTIGVESGWTSPASEIVVDGAAVCTLGLQCTPISPSWAPIITLYWAQYQNAPTVTASVSNSQAFLGTNPTATVNMNYVPQPGTITWQNSQGQTIDTINVSASASPFTATIPLSSTSVGSETYTATYTPATSAYNQANSQQPYSGPYDYVSSAASINWVVANPTVSVSQNNAYIYTPVTVTAQASDVPTNGTLEVATDPNFQNIVCSAVGTGGNTTCQTSQTYDSPTDVTYYVRTVSGSQIFTGNQATVNWVDPTIVLTPYSNAQLTSQPTQIAPGSYHLQLGSPVWLVAQFELNGVPTPWTYAPESAAQQELIFLNSYMAGQPQSSAIGMSCSTWSIGGALANSSTNQYVCSLDYPVATNEEFFSNTELLPSNSTTLNFESNVVDIQWYGKATYVANPT
jgi:hypothetical protein